MDVTHVLVIIVLAVAALVGIGILVLIAIAIKTVFEFFALAKTVHTEVRAIGSSLRAVGDRFAGKADGALGILDFFKSKKSTKKTK